MKKGIFTLFILVTSITCFAQQKNFGTKTIGQWNFEKFPLHYSVNPAKSMSYKNARTGKLERYQEFNNVGQTNGLVLSMCTDGIYPHDATYTYKGEVVYIVQFFPNTKTAQSITTFNSDGLKDGYQITRTLKGGGGYNEVIEKYDNDVLIEINGVKQALISIVYKDSLLDGRFKFENSRSWIIEGEADKGKIKKIKQTQDGKYFMCEIIFLTDSIKVKEPKYSGDGFTFETLPLKSNPIVTNSKSFCMKYGNYSGYPYLLIPNDFDIRDLKELVIRYFPEPIETKANYSDSLLNGDFQYRQYIYNGSYSYSTVIDVTGKAEMGKLLSISNVIVDVDVRSGIKTSEKKIQYIFQGDKILKNDYVPQVPNEPVSSTTLKLEYPVLLTNSKKLGGTFILKANSWDFSPENPKNIFGTPFNRAARLENNKYGYVYFSPFSFDMSNFLEIVTKITEKPIERKINMTNGFLEGAFEFKEDRIYFIGNANAGAIQKLKIIYDFESSKTISAPGTDLNGKNIHYNIMELTKNGDKMDVSYILSEGNKITYQESIPIIKNRKITNTESLATYDNFVFINNTSELREILYKMSFLN